MTLKPTRAHLGRKQRAVMNDLLSGLNKYESFEKNKLSPCRYKKWLQNGLFNRELRARIEAAIRQNKFIVIRSLPKAAERLAQLTKSEKDETARKACLDIISLQKAGAAEEAQRKEKDEEFQNKYNLTHDKAAKIWAIMAEPDEPEKPVAEVSNSFNQQQASSNEQPEVGAGLAPAQTPEPAPESEQSAKRERYADASLEAASRALRLRLSARRH